MIYLASVSDQYMFALRESKAYLKQAMFNLEADFYLIDNNSSKGRRP